MTWQDELVSRVAGAALGRIPTLRMTVDACETIVRENILGDWVECGVFAGVHPALMALTSKALGERRTVHLFDSFEGIPQPGMRDDQSITALVGPSRASPELKTTGVSACSIDMVKQNLHQWKVPQHDLVFHPGWFQHTVPAAVKRGAFPRQISILRLDGDLYESTMVCLEHLHPLVVLGGYVIIDDYALTGCRAAVTEYLGKHGLVRKIIPIAGGEGPAYYRK